ncbi:MAG: magnesium transporter CorA [Lachnospiraceae bacterium]|nr:magnesium transporter CorA [Lachnospiraceae bacterium]
MYYIIENTLRELPGGDPRGAKKKQYVAVLTPQEWQNERENFEMGIDMDLDALDVHTTKAEVNYDSITGTFALPDRKNMAGDYKKFAFALDEKGIVFIDPGDTVSKLIKKIIDTKKWRFPSLERFIYDFLEAIIHDDLPLLEKYERELDLIDRDIDNDNEPDIDRLNDIRGELRDLRIHYDQLIDLSQEFEENENSFFKSENIRFFRLFSNRVSRLFDLVNSLLDYTGQIRDTYSSRLDVRQNRIMTVLTVVTAIFMPLTLIVGWYGMNFKHMPELDSVWGYPAVIVISILIVVFCLIFFKRKKWL